MTLEALDQEEVSKYNMTVWASHMASPTLPALKILLLWLLDINDNVYTFSQTVYTIVLSKDNPVGKILDYLNAMDSSMVENTHVRYILETKPPAATDVNTSCGWMPRVALHESCVLWTMRRHAPLK